MKKALIITYYWPPSGGAGVQRWLKFVKYLHQFGWESVVYTPENGEAPVIDNSLQKDVPQNITILKQPIWEPYNAYKSFIGQNKNEKINPAFLSEGKKPKLTEKLAVWVRGNLFIPDARKFWIKPSIKFLSNYLKINPTDIIISTGPPHSMHLIAMQLNKKLNIPWLADFRDPWTNIDFYKDLKLSNWADKKHHRLEKKVLEQATAITVISNGMAADFRKLAPRNYEVITNGYDAEDVALGQIALDKKFSLAHIGTLVKDRNPHALWKTLKLILSENSDLAKYLEIKLVGKVDFSITQSLKEYGLSSYVNRIEYLSHSEVIKVQCESQVLLLLLNNTPNAKMILTGKFFEYMASRRPILCIGPTDGDAAAILQQTNAGFISDFIDTTTLTQNIISLFSNFKENNLVSQCKNIEKFSRKELTKQLAELMNKITK